MKILIAASEGFTDENLVLTTLQALQRGAGGQVITVATPIGTAVGAIVKRLAAEGADDGLEQEDFDHDWSSIERAYVMFQEGSEDYHAERLVRGARANGIVTLEFFDTLSTNFSG